jgi:hypothetical protein
MNMMIITVVTVNLAFGFFFRNRAWEMQTSPIFGPTYSGKALRVQKRLAKTFFSLSILSIFVGTTMNLMLTS